MIRFEYWTSMSSEILIVLDISQMKKERNVASLLVAVTGLSAIGWLTHSFPPDTNKVIGLFLLIFLSVFSFIFFLTRSPRRALLAGIGVIIFFFLRLIELREPVYVILLAASLISLEVYLDKR